MTGIKKQKGYMILFCSLICLLSSSKVLASEVNDGTDKISMIEENVAQEEYVVLQEQECYRVAFSENHEPYTYQDKNGNATGMAIDIMDYIADLANIKVEYIPISEIEETSSIDISLAILENDGLENITIQSEPYFQLPLMAIGRSSEGVSDNIVVGHMAYIMLNDEIIERELLDSKSYTYDDYEELEEALKNDQLDYIVVSSLVANQFIDIEKAYEMYLIPLNLNLDVSILFNDEMDTDKIEAFNFLIGSLEENKVYAMMLNAALQVNTSQSLTEMLSGYKAEIMGVGFLLLLLVTGAMIKINRDKRVNLLTFLNEDWLTGLATERKFYQEVEKILAKKGDDKKYSIISLDIDNFKYINEVYGYDAGTNTIIAVAHKIKNTYKTAVVTSRVFADQFLLLVEQVPVGHRFCGKKECVSCIEHALHEVLGKEYHLYMSVGVYHITDTSLPLSYMVDCANMAKNDGKKIFGNTYGIFTEEKEKSIRLKNEIVSNMENAITDNEFKMLYQPKIDFQSRKVVGLEALVRWVKADGSQIYPDSFIPIFEKNGFINLLDYYIFGEVCRFLKSNPDLPKIAINLSGVTLADQNLVEHILNILGEYDILANRIEVEITESAFVENFEQVVNQINELRRVGFSVAMDDFGAGVSSLNRLKDISIDVIKMDKEFLGGTVIDEKETIIITSMIHLAKALSMKTVAEGVETKEHVEALCEWGCDIAQGYYFAKPLSEEETVIFCKKNK